MDTGKTYYDSNANECSIWQLVRREPDWAANRVQEGEKAIEKVAELKAEVERLKKAKWEFAVAQAEVKAVKACAEVCRELGKTSIDYFNAEAFAKTIEQMYGVEEER